MRLSRFFIDRPIFAAVIAVLITLAGSIAYFFLPISQYPDIVPPTVTVNAVYPGASAETVADTVANPIEQEINGVDGMLYQASESTADGRMTITVTFQPGTDLDDAQVLVQNRVAIAEARLPEEVQRLGIVTRKTTPDFLMVVNLVSPDGSLDREYISNYAQTRIKDRLARLDGVGDVQLFGQRELAMRVWIDPGRAAALGLTGSDIVRALRSQNVQVAAGTLGQQPSPGSAFQLNVETEGRFTNPAQFGQVVIRTDVGGRQVRVNDVARVEIGAADYATSAYLNDMDSVILPVFQKPGSNALSAAEGVKATMDELSGSFPAGLEYRIVYNPTEFIAQSIDAVLHTLIEAMVLVVLVIIVFLQKARASIIPVLAIPISLVGTFAVLAMVGYSLNNLSLFGLVLAIGIVVDDAIVVVENVERNLEAGFSPLEAARRSMDEVGEALVAIVLVLCAVFVPTLFMGGLSGEFYKQFAVTISAATVISLIVSLTLSPALSAMLLRPHEDLPADAPRWRRAIDTAGGRFNAMFERFSNGYASLTARLVAMPRRMMVAYAVLIGLTGVTLAATPTGFIPQQDQGYFVSVIQLPPGSATTRTDAVMKQVADRVLELDGVKGVVMLSGFDGTTQTQSASSAAAYWVLDDFATRQAKGLDVDTLIAEAQKATTDINEARLMIIKPPVIQGIGSAGGFRMMLQDNSGKGYRALQDVANTVIAKANGQPGLAGVYTFFDTGTPRVKTDIDRDKAQMLGVAPSDIFDTLSVYLGSAFVNEFNLLGRTYRVTAQADAPYRADVSDIAGLYARSGNGAMVPLGSVATFSDTTGPYRVSRYNLTPAVAIDGDTAPGGSTGQSLTTMEKVAAETLPGGYSTDWTGIAFQQATTGNTVVYVFGLAVLLVFLVLAAQYESLILPLAIILIVPMCLLAAMVGVNLRGMDNNVLTQIGLVVLIALSAKNAILIVEFARQGERDHGLSPAQAAVEAARSRLRPILMTSFAFILGSVPLVIATGAGAELRQALGTAVCFGMLGVTGFGLIFTPTFYVVSRALGDRIAGLRRRGGHDAVAFATGRMRSITMPFRQALLAAVPAFALSACAAAPVDVVSTTVPPAATADPFLSAEAGVVSATPLPADWWRLYDDPVLDSLVADAAAANTDVRQAAARIERARAALRGARADRLPIAGLSASTGYARLPTDQIPPGVDRTGATFSLGADVSYELDLFGRVSSGVAAARGDLGAAQADAEAVRVMVVSDTTQAYADAASAAARLETARSIVALLDETLRLTRKRHDVGLSDGLAVARIEALREQRAGTIPAIQAQRNAAMFALATLTGRTPSQLPPIAGERALPLEIISTIPVGDGAQLLARRPDVRAAEKRLLADLARVGVARADLYPRITLGGSIGSSASSIGRLFSGGPLGVVLGPLIDWAFPNREPVRARIDAANADATGSLAAFDGAVLTALQETETALSDYARALEQRRSLTAASAAAQRAATITRAQNREGVINSLQTLDAERTLAEAQAALADQDALVSRRQIALFRALGGGWSSAEMAARP